MNNNEYDQRQLKLMLINLHSFEIGKIELHSLIGSLEFLLNAMESVKDEWEEKFLKEISTLETVNAINIISENEEPLELSNENANILIQKSVYNLKLLIEKELNME